MTDGFTIVETSFDEAMYDLIGAVVGQAALDLLNPKADDADRRSAYRFFANAQASPCKIQSAYDAEMKRRHTDHAQSIQAQLGRNILLAPCNVPDIGLDEQIPQGNWKSGELGVTWKKSKWMASLIIRKTRIAKYFPGTRRGMEQAAEWYQQQRAALLRSVPIAK